MHLVLLSWERNRVEANEVNERFHGNITTVEQPRGRILSCQIQMFGGPKDSKHRFKRSPRIQSAFHYTTESGIYFRLGKVCKREKERIYVV